MSLFGGCGTRTSLRASLPRSSIASGSSTASTRVCTCVYVCMYVYMYLTLRENPRKVCAVHLVRACMHTLVHACVQASLCAQTCVCARNRAYVTAWLGAQIQRAQLAHRTSRRIVLILRLHSRDVETASSRLLPRATGCLCFKARRRRTDGLRMIRTMIGDFGSEVRYFDVILVDLKMLEASVRLVLALGS